MATRHSKNAAQQCKFDEVNPQHRFEMIIETI